MSLALARCFNHGGREAVARCLGCGRPYCRECVTEHAGQLRCARCLADSAAAASARRVRARAAVHVALALAGAAAGFGVLYGTTRKVGRVPDQFHDGTFWLQLAEDR